MTTEEKLALWKIANDLRVEQGLSEMCWADFHFFLTDFASLSVQFDAVFSDALAKKEQTA